jgi:hypothetical protein
VPVEVVRIINWGLLMHLFSILKNHKILFTHTLAIGIGIGIGIGKEEEEQQQNVCQEQS